MPDGVYLHIPFCKSRCSYCDFATDVYRSADAVDRYITAIAKEIASHEVCNPRSKIQNPKSIDTIYFGGGTPSLLSPGQVEGILKSVGEAFDIASGVEVTMEMNPGTVTPEALAGYRSLGVNRASFGVQTFDDRALRLLARGHDARDARQTFSMLRDAGFGNISFDLIAGLPGQTLDDWRRNLDAVVEMQPEHVSLYLLEVHEGTPLAEQIRSGRQPLPDEELAADMYVAMVDILGGAGYEQYEISNFARPGFQSRHNTKYWKLDPVFGFGVSAHSFDGSDRYANERDSARYVDMVEADGTAEVSRERVDLASEFAFLNLRLNAGLDLNAYLDRFDVNLLQAYGEELARFSDAGLIEIQNDVLKLTRRGKLFSNEVFSVFV